MIREARERRPPALRAGHRNFLARLRRAAASSDASLHFCERGAVAPLSHFPPGHAGSEQSSLPLFLRARQYSNARESRGHGAPVSDRHRAGARNPHQQRCAPPISLLRTAHRRSALNRGDMERRSPPVSDRHRAGANETRTNGLRRLARARNPPISLLRTAYRRSALNRGDMERRSPTGIARERETRTNNAAPRRGAPVSDRHRAGARNPHQQRCAPPISLLRTAYRRSALNRGDMERRSPTGIARERETRTNNAAPRRGAPVSDRHRAGARNPHQQRCAPPISLLRTAYRRSALNRGDGSGNADLWAVLPVGAGTARRRRANHVQPTGGMSRTCTATPVEVPVAVRTIPLFEVRLARRAARGCADQRSAFPCLRVIVPLGDTPRREPCRCLRFVSPAALRAAVPAPTGRTGQRSAFPCLRVAVPPGDTPGREPCRRLRFVSPAALRAAVPTGGRRSLACASPCLLGIRRDGSHAAV